MYLYLIVSLSFLWYIDLRLFISASIELQRFCTVREGHGMWGSGSRQFRQWQQSRLQVRRDSGDLTILTQRGRVYPTTTDKAINSRIIFHCSEEKTRNRKCLEESLTSNALCTSNVQLLDQTEKALHGTLSNERLFCNEVNLNTASLDDDIQSLVDCQPEFFDKAENCARPFRDNFKTTAAAERISDQTCRFVCMGRKGREGKMLQVLFLRVPFFGY